MAKELITRENVSTKPHYRDILNLLITFHDKGGLSFWNLKQVLVKGGDINKIQGEYGRRFKQLVIAKRIEANTITTESNLNKYLRRLLPEKLPNSLGIIQKSEDKKPQYKIKKSYFKELQTFNIKFNLDEHKSDFITFYSKNFKFSPELKQYADSLRIIMYGIPEKIYNSLTKEEQNKIEYYINEINHRIYQIERINLLNFKENCDKILKKVCNEFDMENQKLKKFVEENIWDFVEHCTLIFEDDRNKNKDMRQLLACRLLNDKTLKMSTNDKINFLYLVTKRLWEKKYIGEMFYKYIPRGITISRFYRS